MESISLYLVFALICIPIIPAILMLFIKKEKPRKIFVYVFGAAIALCSIIFCTLNIGVSSNAVPIENFADEIFHWTGVVISIALASVIVIFGFKYKNKIAIILALVQVLVSVFVEVFIVPQLGIAETSFCYNSFSVIMVFIIGVIGSGICIYAIGYMSDFNKHLKEGQKDRSNKFFSLIFSIII